MALTRINYAPALDEVVRPIRWLRITRVWIENRVRFLERSLRTVVIYTTRN